MKCFSRHWQVSFESLLHRCEAQLYILSYPPLCLTQRPADVQTVPGSISEAPIEVYVQFSLQSLMDLSISWWFAGEVRPPPQMPCPRWLAWERWELEWPASSADEFGCKNSQGRFGSGGARRTPASSKSSHRSRYTYELTFERVPKFKYQNPLEVTN